MGKAINEHIVQRIKEQHPNVFNEAFDGARKWQDKIIDPDTEEYVGLDDSHGGMLYTRYIGEDDEEFELADNQYDSKANTYRVESEMRLVGYHYCEDEEAIKNSVVSSLLRMNWDGLQDVKPEVEIEATSSDTLAIWREELPEGVNPKQNINLFKVDFTLSYEFDPSCEPVTCKRCE